MRRREEAETDPAEEVKRRVRWIAPVVVVVVAVLLLAAGWGAATVFRSPDQEAARSTPPPLSTITAQVEEGTLAEVVSTRGTVKRSAQSTLRLGEASSTASVTRVPIAKGQVVGAGSVVVEINGEPVFVLPGGFPFYRDLALGDTGPDVEQLQAGLAAAGYSVTVDGILGAGTRQALVALYESAGYEKPFKDPKPIAQPSPQATSSIPGGVTSSSGDNATAGEVDNPVLVRLGAIAVTPTLPSAVVEVPAVGAAPPEGVVMTLAAGELHFESEVSYATSLSISPGMSGIARVDGVPEISVAVISVTPKQDQSGAVILLGAQNSDLPLEQETAEAVIEISLSDGQPVSLIVPSIAVIVRGDKTYVRKLQSGSDFVEVGVTEIDTSNGRSAIMPLDPSVLQAGDVVKVQ